MPLAQPQEWFLWTQEQAVARPPSLGGPRVFQLLPPLPYLVPLLLPSPVQALSEASLCCCLSGCQVWTDVHWHLQLLLLLPSPGSLLDLVSSLTLSPPSFL